MSHRKGGFWRTAGLSLREKISLIRSLPGLRSRRALNYHANRAFFGGVREWLTRRLMRWVPAAEHEALEDDPALSALLTQGFVRLGDLCPPEMAQALFDELEDVPCRDPYRPELGTLRGDTLPAETHVAHLDRGPLIRSRTAMDLANHPRILSLVGAWLGAKPTVLISAWWSVAAEGPAEEAERFHRDKDDWRFIKLFVYLTEVTEETGPHVFVPRSHHHAGVEFRHQRRYTDAEVAAVYPPEHHQVFVGPPGMAILENTYGLHKGLPPRAGRRLIFQVTYSLFPLMYAPDEPEVGASELVGRYDPYINRVHVDPTR